MTEVSREHIEIVEGAGGPKARIVRHRIRVQDIVIWYEKLGLSADEIVDNYPTITMADVHAALAYYWDHRDEIERAIADGDALAEEIPRTSVSPLAEKLRKLHSG